MHARITSKANPRVRSLKAALALRSDTAIAVEGFHLVREAIASGLPLTSLYVREDQETAARSLFDAVPEVFLLSHEAFGAAAATEHSQGVAATLPRPQNAYQPRRGDLVLLVDGVQDPGNLGTLIRSAEAFGAAAVALGENTVDPWNGKCLRASAGAAFRMPMPSWDEPLHRDLLRLSARAFAAVPHDARAAHETDLTGTTVLIIGNEGAGISPGMMSLADARVTVSTTGPTESLNAAVAGSVLLYEASRQRSARRPG